MNACGLQGVNPNTSEMKKNKITINLCIDSVDSAAGNAGRLDFFLTPDVVKVDFPPKTKGEDAIYAACIFWHHRRSFAFPDIFCIF